MHDKVLPRGSKRLLAGLAASASPALKGWTLAGGTGLALQLGHRVSEDFDFFRKDPIALTSLHDILGKQTDYETLQEAEHALTVIAAGVKMSFFIVSHPFLFPTRPYRFFHVADVRDIALMTLAAIAGRGSRKDFIDLYTVLRSGLILRDYLDLMPKKYGKGRANLYHVLKSLTYFEDAEQEPMPRMLEPFDWVECKAFFVREAHAIVLPE